MALALEDMGLTVFSAFLSTATQQLVLLIFSSSYAFTKFCIVMEMVVLTGKLRRSLDPGKRSPPSRGEVPIGVLYAEALAFLWLEQWESEAKRGRK